MSTVLVKTELPFEELLQAVEQLSPADLEQLMVQIISLQAQHKAPRLSDRETDLLLKINQGLSSKTQKRFNELLTKRQAEALTSVEHQELISLTDQIERSDTDRAKYMVELAQLRGISLIQLMNNLGIYPPAYA